MIRKVRKVKKVFRGVTPRGREVEEALWIRIQEQQGETLFGYLDSDSIYDCGVSPGDPVQVDLRDELVEVLYE
jgi:hypothetical protein